jgi:hypothetical protein
MAGRPAFEITDEVLEETKTLAGQGLTKYQIAICLGISNTTLKTKQKTNAAFLSAIKEGQAQGIQKVTNHLFTQSEKGNVTASIFYLKNRAPDEWHDRKEIVIEDVTKPLNMSDQAILDELRSHRDEAVGTSSPTTH